MSVYGSIPIHHNETSINYDIIVCLTVSCIISIFEFGRDILDFLDREFRYLQLFIIVGKLFAINKLIFIIHKKITRERNRNL